MKGSSWEVRFRPFPSGSCRACLGINRAFSGEFQSRLSVSERNCFPTTLSHVTRLLHPLRAPVEAPLECAPITPTRHCPSPPLPASSPFQRPQGAVPAPALRGIKVSVLSYSVPLAEMSPHAPCATSTLCPTSHPRFLVSPAVVPRRAVYVRCKSGGAVASDWGGGGVTPAGMLACTFT